MKKQKITKLFSLPVAILTFCTALLLTSTTSYAANDVTINATNFPDENFRTYITSFDTDKNSILSSKELKSVKEINVINNEISSLKGIEYFTSLTELRCQDNNLTTLDISKNTALTLLACSNNRLSSLDISKNLELKDLTCFNNQLTSLDFSNNPKLTDLNGESNYMNIELASDETFDLSKFPNIDISKTSNWYGATISDTILTFDPVNNENYISYKYDCGNNQSFTVKLVITHIHYGKLKPAKNETCNEAGSKAYYKCFCGKYFEDSNCSKEITTDIKDWKYIPKKKHSFDNEVIKKATLNQNGLIFKKCTSCGHQESSLIYYPKTITLSSESYTYNGKAKKPRISIADSNGKTINAGNYTVSYPHGRKNVGTYNVTITFKGIQYEGISIKTFTIKPLKSNIKNIKSSKKAFTLNWTKISKKMKINRITGYEIQYSTSSKFNAAKTKKVKGYNTTKKKISHLKSKKKYYVRIRTYIKVNKKNFYSDWSKVKTIKTK